MKEQKAAANMLGMRPQGSVIDETDYVDYARYYQEFDDEEEVEDYYYSSAAGRARIVIGNRRHGPNGYMSSGRMQARPNPPQPDTVSSFIIWNSPCPSRLTSQLDWDVSMQFCMILIGKQKWGCTQRERIFMKMMQSAMLDIELLSVSHSTRPMLALTCWNVSWIWSLWLVSRRSYKL